MKSLNNKVLALTLLTVLSVPAMAHDYHDGHHHPHPGYGDGYGDGFLDGLIASTLSLYISEISSYDYKQNIYIGADEDAALFLAGQAEVSPLLRSAIEMEREFLVKNDHAEALSFSDEDLAYIVMARVALTR